jgi:XrtN system VIT domain protein
MIRMSEDNRKELFERLTQRSFSLFPFHQVKDVQHSLVVSSSETHSPNISELEGTVFLNRLKAFAAKGSKVKFFHLGGELSSYLRSVKEFRLLEYEQGDAALLGELLRKGEFVQDNENDSEVIVHSAEIAIAKVPGSRPSTAPDHLMRLFAYNHIMQQMGANGLTGKEGEEDSTLVEEAHRAYVVSPVSSLVVLETQKDYDRFDIKDEGNSLKNASFSANGAVPEPHEWAMIVLLLVVVLFVYIKVKI